MKAFTIRALIDAIKEIKINISELEKQESFIYRHNLELSSAPYHIVQERLDRSFPNYDVSCNFNTGLITISKKSEK